MNSPQSTSSKKTLKNKSKETLDLLTGFNDAIRSLNLDQVKLLGSQVLDKIGHFNTQNKDGDTALLLASIGHCEKSLEIIKYLLENDANPNTSSQIGDTPLHVCVIHYDFDLSETRFEMIALLLKYGAKMETKNQAGDRPYHLIFEFKPQNFLMLEFLIALNIDLNAPGKNGNTLLHKMARNSTPEGVCLLLKKEVIIDPINDYHNTPLYLATFYEDLSMVKFLVEAGANVNFTCESMKTPTLVAFQKGNVELFQTFLDRGGDIMALDEKGQDLFHKFKSPSAQIQALYEQEKLKRNLPEHLNKNKTLNPRL